MWYRWRATWDDDASQSFTLAALKVVALLVELGARPLDDTAANTDKPLAWCARQQFR